MTTVSDMRQSALLAVLLKCEWAASSPGQYDIGSDHFCPVCRGYRPDAGVSPGYMGHKEDCALKKAIEELS